jgi:hypothetical protein
MEIRAAAENVLPGRSHGGKRFCFLLRLRRRLGLGITSQRGLALALTEHGKKPPAEPDKKRPGPALRGGQAGRPPQAPEPKGPPAQYAYNMGEELRAPVAGPDNFFEDFHRVRFSLQVDEKESLRAS